MCFRRFTLLIQLALSAAAPLLAQPSFGMIGIGYNQNLRLNIIAFPCDSYMAQLSIAGAAGAQVGPSTTVSLSADLMPVAFSVEESASGAEEGI